MKRIYLIKLNIGLIILTLMMLWIRPLDDLRNYVLVGNRDFSDRVFVYGESVMSQEFTLDVDADTVEILVSAIDKNIGGTYNVRLYDRDGNSICSFETYVSELPDDAVMKYRIRGGLSGGYNYRIVVDAPDLTQETAIIVAGSVSVYKTYFNLFAVLAILLVFIAANIWVRCRDKSIELISLPVLIISAFVFFLILAPGSTPDESFHYYSSFRSSNMLMARKDVNLMESGYRYDFVDGSNDVGSYLKQIKDIRRLKDVDRELIPCEQDTSTYRNIFAHLAPALGITLGRLAGLNFMGIYTLGRLFNMLQYVFLAYFAVRLVPRNKELMLMIAIMPMVLQQCVCMSYDSIVNGLSLLFISYVLKIIYDKRGMTVKQAIICVLLMAILAPVKIVYVVLALLLLAVSKDYAKKTIPVIGIAGIVLLVFKWKDIWVVLNNSVGEAWWTGGLESHTLSFIFEHPLRYIRAVLYSIEADGLTYIKDMVGIGLSVSRITISDYIALIYIVLVVLCVFSEGEPVLENKWQNVVFVLTSVVGIMAIFTVYLLNCTVYGQPRIMGMQGRYFIPFIVPILYCIHGKNVRVEMNRRALFVPIWFIQIDYIIYALNQVGYDI